MIETVEGSLGVPDPETLARESKISNDEVKEMIGKSS